ncbi:MAG TPA: hypothetical protein VGC73_09390 [Pyrinomonadaceae bacterium]|jgi:PleD family two-component response regulator
MQEKSILLVQFEGGEQLTNALRPMLESCPERDFEITCKTVEGNHTELSQMVLRQKPSLIFVALPRVQMKSLDALLEALRPGSSPAPIVVVVETDQEELAELVRPDVADFIIPPLRESEVLVRLRRLLNQVTEERKTHQALTQKFGFQNAKLVG